MTVTRDIGAKPRDVASCETVNDSRTCRCIKTASTSTHAKSVTQQRAMSVLFEDTNGLNI